VKVGGQTVSQSYVSATALKVRVPEGTTDKDVAEIMDQAAVSRALLDQYIGDLDTSALSITGKKLDELKATQEKMKAANRAIRMKDSEKGNAKLKELGFSDEQIKELRTADFCGRLGFPDYALQNNNANIHRTEDRLKSLKATKEKGTQETECKFFKVVKNTEIMRLQLIFDGKPDPEVRDILKGNGFKWAPSQSAWQRQLTGNAEYALQQVIKELEKLEGETP